MRSTLNSYQFTFFVRRRLDPIKRVKSQATGVGGGGGEGRGRGRGRGQSVTIIFRPDVQTGYGGIKTILLPLFPHTLVETF
jgi:hypothetical protein